MQTNIAEQGAKLDPQVVGNVGLYYTCYRLSMLGWNVMPTARNAKGVDIVAYDRSATRYVGIQVKTLSKRPPVVLGKSLDKVMGDFWVIVTRIATGSPQTFVLLPEEVRDMARFYGKDYFLDPKAYGQDRFSEAFDRIGTSEGGAL